MYIFTNPDEQNKREANGYGYNAFMDVINIASFLIGLQNLDLNITANDLDKQTNSILEDLHEYFEKQDKHLLEQDKHLFEQDIRLENLERMLYN